MKYLFLLFATLIPLSVQAKVDLPAKLCTDGYETVEAYETCMKDALPRDDETTNRLYSSLMQILKDPQRQSVLHTTQDKWFAAMFRRCRGSAVSNPDKTIYNAAETSCLALGYETRMVELDKITSRCQSDVPGDIAKCNADIKLYGTDPGSL